MTSPSLSHKRLPFVHNIESMSKQRRVTRELLADVSKRAQILKLRTEIALIDRELDTIQNELGVSLYDALEQQADVLPEVLHQAYDDCRSIVSPKQQEISNRHDTIDSHQSQRMRAAEPTTLSERATRLQHAIASHSSDAKLKVEIRLLEHSIVREKQIFGHVVFDACMQLGHSNELEVEAIQDIIDATYDLSTDPTQRKAERLEQIEQLEAELIPKDDTPLFGNESTDVEQ